MDDFWDAAQLLAERYNEFLMTNGDYNLINDEEMVEILKAYVTNEALAQHIDDDFSRGLLLGRVLSKVEYDGYGEREET